MSTVEAGWYSDPWEDGKIRFWDGVTWTDEQYDAEDSEYDVHGDEDPTPPVDHTVAPSSVLRSGQAFGSVPPAQDTPAADQGVPPSAPSAPGYGQMPPSAPSAPGYGQMPPSAASAPGYGQMPPSAASAPGYGQMPPSAASAPGYGQMPPSAPSAPGYGAPGYGAPGQPTGGTPGSVSGWSAGSSAEAGWAGQTGPGFYGLPGAGSPSSTGPVAASGNTAPFGDGYGGYAATGAGSYASGGTAAYPQGPGQPWAGSPESAGGFPPQAPGFGGSPQAGGYGGPPQGGGGYGSGAKRSGLSPLLAGGLVLAIVAVLGVGAYFIFLSGDDDPSAGGGGGGGSSQPAPGPAPADALTLTDSSGAEVPESGTVTVPADGAWTGTITVTERTGFLALAAYGEADPQIAVSGEGVSVEVDDVGSASRDLAPLGGDSGLDAAVGLVLEPGTYTIEVTDWLGRDAEVPFQFRSGLQGTLSNGAPVDATVAANDVVLMATEPASSSGSVHTLLQEGSDPQLVAFPAGTGEALYNDDGRSLAPADIADQMSSLDSYIDISASEPTLVVLTMWQERAGSASVTYTDQ
ncbi:DUF2510 domain-containing protein [Georgenia sp. Z1344]|uniref:DUF2510 domain-containing protein n=1 Tax=Georgenia sp. Z1344 TaxID=3416706 RepID=UPI003CFA9E09